LKLSSNSRPIITFCRTLDNILGGGVQIGQITEFCGVPGVGKTQLGIQLSLTVQIPEVFNGNAGEAVYIDTEGSFMVERVAEMATEISNHLNRIAKLAESKKSENFAAQIASSSNMSMERLLEGVHVFRSHDQAETVAIINRLPSFLKAKTKVKLIVVDSIAFHFRHDLLGDSAARSRVLGALAQSLHQVAFEHSLAVVLVNHVTTKFVENRNSSSSSSSFVTSPVVSSLNPIGGGVLGLDDGNVLKRLSPALGEQWSHSVTNRVMLHWVEQGTMRRASLVKSPTMPQAFANYCVCEKGIRDVNIAEERKRKLN
jgi:RAD51-like protein 2